MKRYSNKTRSNYNEYSQFKIFNESFGSKKHVHVFIQKNSDMISCLNHIP